MFWSRSSNSFFLSFLSFLSLFILWVDGKGFIASIYYTWDRNQVFSFGCEFSISHIIELSYQQNSWNGKLKLGFLAIGIAWMKVMFRGKVADSLKFGKRAGVYCPASMWIQRSCLQGIEGWLIKTCADCLNKWYCNFGLLGRSC